MEYIINFDMIYLKKYIDNYNKNNLDNQIVGYNGATVCEASNSYSVLQLQPKAELIVNADTGIVSKDAIYSEKIDKFINMALSKEKTYGLVLTPEYSVPLSSINKLIEQRDRIKQGTLFCLCCQSVKQHVFEEFLNEIKSFSNVEIVDEPLRRLQPKNLVCCLLYVLKVRFFLKEGDMDRVFVIPQFKTCSMKDPTMEFESQSLTCGKDVIEFGREDEVKFMSIICADVFNFELINQIKKRVEKNKVFLFNPQLNKKPQNDYFRFMRNMLINFSETQYIKILTLNWSVETKLLIDGESVKNAVDASWSALYEKYDENKFAEYMEILNRNIINGINFAHDYHIAMLFMSTEEHILEMNIAKLNRGSFPSDTRETIPIKISKRYVFDDNINEFVESEKSCINMIDKFFRNNDEFIGLIDCKNCKKTCTVNKINEFLASLSDMKQSKEFQIINDGKITSVTAKHYKSEYSREKLYLCKRILKKMRNKEVTKKFRSQNSTFVYSIDEKMPVFNTIYYCSEKKQFCRVIYMKNTTFKEVEKKYRELFLKYKEFAENFMIYYEDEDGDGVHLYEDNVKTEILKYERTNATILAGGILNEN